ncbi:tonB-dependent receptor [Streptomyces laurentii]|uniref:TonB-dependent receptor n=1 Tax=Streptomyces laurentii TaxID=39478 RepID=A0A169MY17_STRLU|nr:tonB-dependent receptor [Streptomyces laurentii]
MPDGADEGSGGNAQAAVGEGRAGDLAAGGLEGEGGFVGGELPGLAGDLDVEVDRVAGGEGRGGVLVAVRTGGDRYRGAGRHRFPGTGVPRSVKRTPDGEPARSQGA